MFDLQDFIHRGYRLVTSDCHRHGRRRHKPVDERWDEQQKNSPNFTTPFCQTMSVVISPNGLKAPPALAATTTLMQPKAMKRPLSAPIVMNDRTHDQSRREVIGHRGDKGRQKAGQPEYAAQR